MRFSLDTLLHTWTNIDIDVTITIQLKGNWRKYIHTLPVQVYNKLYSIMQAEILKYYSFNPGCGNHPLLLSLCAAKFLNRQLTLYSRTWQFWLYDARVDLGLIETMRRFHMMVYFCRLNVANDSENEEISEQLVKREEHRSTWVLGREGVRM